MAFFVPGHMVAFAVQLDVFLIWRNGILSFMDVAMPC
jgi:hypothetical protein